MTTRSSKGTLSDSQRAARNSELIGYSLLVLRGLADKLFLVLAAYVGALYFDLSALGYQQMLVLLPAILLIQLGRELCMAPFSFIDHQRVGAKFFKGYTWRVWSRSVRRNSLRRLNQTVFIVTATYVLVIALPMAYLPASILIAALALAILPWEKSAIEPRDVEHEQCTDEALLSRIEAMLTEVGLKRESVKIVKLSEKVTMANAWMCGSEVWLGDTLLAGCTADGVDSVVGHELGHYYHQHSANTGFFAGVNIWLSLMAGFLTLMYTYPLGEPFANWLVTIPVFLLAYELMRMMLKRLELARSRRNEREADEYALNKVGAKGARELRDGLCGANRPWENPWTILVWLFSTHPSSAQRSAHVDEWESRRATSPAVILAPPDACPAPAAVQLPSTKEGRLNVALIRRA